MFSLIACCPTLNVFLENDVKDKQGKSEGIYTFQGFSDGMDYWVDAEGENAIWYEGIRWRFGLLEQLGTTGHGLYSDSSHNNPHKDECPNNEGYVWNWKYDHEPGVSSGMSDTNDVYIKCANEDDFCTTDNPCVVDEGDCDTHDECQDGLFCDPAISCAAYLGFASDVNCCFSGSGCKYH